MSGGRVTVGRRRVDLTHPDKVLYPDEGITKAELVEHYRRVADLLLPHVRDCPLALQRFPDGIGDQGFFQKKRPDSAPDWVDAVRVAREGAGDTVEMINCTDAATLVYLGNQAALALHPWLSHADEPHRPVRLIFDLDPDDDDFDTVRWAARTLHELLDELGLPAYPMTTGSRGLHVTVPLRPAADFDTVRAFAGDTAAVLAARHPDRLTTEVRRQQRRGRLFLDTLRNAYAQHAVAPYSPRPLPGAPVATPLDWSEIDDAALGPRRYGIRTMARRLTAAGDPWRGMARHARTLTAARRRLDALR